MDLNLLFIAKVQNPPLEDRLNLKLDTAILPYNY